MARQGSKKRGSARKRGKAKRPGKAKARRPRAPGKKGAASRKASSFKCPSLKEAAAAVFAGLAEAGHDPILTGQACAAIYAGASVKARAMEFVIRDYAVDSVNVLMRKMGFRAKEMHTFVDGASPYEVTLSPAPLVVGDDAVSDAKVIKTTTGPLRLLTPTDCVRQRLSMFYRWGDRNALAEAVHVARRQTIDMNLVRRWSEWEWATDRFEEFLQALGRSS